MRVHGLIDGFNSELLENAFHVSQTIASCTSPAHLLHKFFLVTRSEGASLGIRRLTSFRPHSVTDCFLVPGTLFRFLLSFDFEGNVARVQPGSPETAQERSQGSQEPGESPFASRRLPERLHESSPGKVLEDMDPS